MREGPKPQFLSPNDDEAKKLVAENAAQYGASEADQAAALNKPLGYEAPQEQERVERETYEEMLKEMREQVDLLNNDPEIQENGFTYPEEWLDAFEKKVNKILDEGGDPDIGIFGYGSLQSRESRGHLEMSGEHKSGIGVMEGTRRGLYLNGSVRTIKDWEHVGRNPDEAHGVMAIKYDKDARMNGMRIPILHGDLAKLGDREFAYFMLPGPPVVMKDGEVAELNLVCWPMGRHLMDTHPNEGIIREYEQVSGIQERGATAIPVSQEEMKKMYERQAEFEGILKEVFGEEDIPADVQYGFFREYLEAKKHEYFEHAMTPEEEKETFRRFAEGVVYAYQEHIAAFCDLSKRVPPHPAYVEVCMQLDDPDDLKEFLQTTYCYGPDGEEMLLADYLKEHRPKDDPRWRPNRDVPDRQDLEATRRARSRTLHTRPWGNLTDEEIQEIFRQSE